MPYASLADLPAQIALALSLASSSTGADYHYLLSTARSESSFQAEAKAPTSSAQGLFQFIEETWIRTIKDEGGRYGLGDYAARIVKTATGRYVVPSPADRIAILQLRRDPKISAMMAGAYAKRNAEFVAAEIGRRPTSDELYIAHFLGPADAARLIVLRDSQPALSAPDLFPAAAKSNRTIFFADAGARSVGQVYDLLVARQHAGGAVTADTGAFFSGGIDFGSWSPTVEMITDVRPSHPKQQLAQMDAISPSGDAALQGEAPAPKPAIADRTVATAVATDTQGGTADGDPAKEIAYVTIADDPDAPEGSLLGGTSSSETVATVREAKAPAISSKRQPSVQRLKFIHVAPK